MEKNKNRIVKIEDFTKAECIFKKHYFNKIECCSLISNEDRLYDIIGRNYGFDIKIHRFQGIFMNK